MNYEFKTYQQMKSFIEGLKTKWCEECEEKTYHIKRGQAYTERYSCIKCEEKQ